jgi:hypothetical protein
MATDHNHHGQAHHSDVAFEHSDLSHRGIWAFFIFLGVSTMVIFLAIGALYKGFGYARVQMEAEPNPMAVSDKMPAPAEMQNTAPVDLQKFSGNGTQPLLQSNDVVDMESFLRQEEQLLKAAPWKEENGTVHLPIDHAMQLVMQRNQPARANGSNPSIHDPNMVPTEAGFFGTANVHQQADATMVEGAPMGDTQVESPAGHEKQLQGIDDKGPKNPARARGEHQSASPEQKIKTPPPSAKAPKQ